MADNGESIETKKELFAGFMVYLVLAACAIASLLPALLSGIE
jgi:hypothetical protein